MVTIDRFHGPLLLDPTVEKVDLLWQGPDKPPQVGHTPGAVLVPTLEEEDRARNRIWIHRLPIRTKLHLRPAVQPSRSLSCCVAFARRKPAEPIFYLDLEGHLTGESTASTCTATWCTHHYYGDG